jgi:uncharacterized protein DUF6624
MKRLLILLPLVMFFTATILGQNLNDNDSLVPDLLSRESGKTKNEALQKELEAIGVRDQCLRMLLPSVTEKFGKDSPELKYFWSLIWQQDSLNEQAIELILMKNGWPGISEVDTTANQALWLVIQHAPLAKQEKYLPLLAASVDAGDSQAWHLAFLEDRVLMRKGLKQKYGSQAAYDKKEARFYIYPIEDAQNVNQRRAKIGLESIEEYAKSNNYYYK